MRTRLVLAVAALVLAGCTPWQAAIVNGASGRSDASQLATDATWYRARWCADPAGSVQVLHALGLDGTRLRTAGPVPSCHPTGWLDLGHGVWGPPILTRIRACESGGDYTARNPRSSAAGAWQFLGSTWASVTGSPAPASAYPPATQDAAAVKLYRRSGTSPWSPSRHCW